MGTAVTRRQVLRLGLAGGLGYGLGLDGAHARTAPPSLPGAAARARVDRYARQWLKDQQMPGLALALLQDGEPLYAAGLGWGDAGRQRAVTLDTRFAICSISKPLLCCAAQLMVEDGQLRLDQRLADLIEGLPERWHAITLQQLMQHTAGLPHNVDLTDPEVRALFPRHYDEAQWLPLVMRLPLLSPPGQRFLYSNVGYNLLASALSRLAGRPYEQVLAQRLFEPLGMTSARLMAPAPGFADMAAPHQRRSGAVVDIGAEQPPGVRSWMAAGCGGFELSLRDMIQWERALHGWGAYKPYRPVFEKLWAQGVPTGEGPAYGLGWNFQRDPAGRLRCWHEGQSEGFSARFERSPSQGRALIALGNLGDFKPADLGHAVQDLLWTPRA